MGTTLSPFRYLQLARYIVQRWVEIAPTALTASRKGKGRARDLTTTPRTRAVVEPPRYSSILSAAATEQSGGSSESLAGPSNYPDLLPRPDAEPEPGYPPESKEIYRLMNDVRLFTPGAMQPPREIVVLCHGLYGFSTATPIPLFPSLKLHYWASVLEVLRDRMGVKVVVVGVKGTGSVKERAEQMHAFLKDYLPKGVGVNFVAHSMGGLDCRHLISTIRPTHFKPLSLTTIGTPHRGSPFMDWCAANIGVGSAAAVAKAAATAAANTSLKSLPYSLKSPLLSRPPTKSEVENGSGKKGDSGVLGLPTFFTSALTSYLLNIFDSPAYSNLTTHFLRDEFNPSTPDDPNVKYTSVAGRITKMSVLHPLWFPKLVLDASAENGYAEDEGQSGKEYEGNDGLVSVSSAKWGEFIGVVDGCHHWDLRGEGGLFPNGGTTSTKPTGKPDGNQPGGWDWQGTPVGEHLGLISNKSGDAKKDLKMEKEKDAGKAGISPSSSESSSSPSSSWDLAQVGQVVDWVTDLLPGNNNSETGQRQLADAKREKAREEGQGGKEEEKKLTSEDKKRKEKFDLAKFYGGLMIKLREDGF